MSPTDVPFPTRSGRRLLPVGALAVAAALTLSTGGLLLARALQLGRDAAALLGTGADAGRVVAVTPVEDLVEAVTVLLGLGVSAWLAVCLTAGAVCAGARLLGRRWRLGERCVVRLAPVVVRRAVALSAGTGLAIAAAGAPASAEVAPPPVDLGWAPSASAEPWAPAPAPTTTQPVPAPASAPQASEAAVAPPGSPPGGAGPEAMATPPQTTPDVSSDAAATTERTSGGGADDDAPYPVVTPGDASAPAAAATGAAGQDARPTRTPAAPAGAAPATGPTPTPPTAASPPPVATPPDAAGPAPATASAGATTTPVRTTGAVTGPAATPTVGSATTPSVGSATTAAVVTVRPGDTLWGIASDFLPADASPADIAAAWPRWYAANSDVIGADPGLIRPGQRLVHPAGTADAGRTAPVDGAGS